MNYEEARAYLEEAARAGSVLGLENIRELTRRLGNPQDSLKFIHIAGTNGKGSLLAYLSSILKEAGYFVGRYISPTLFSYRERIQVNEEVISREALARLTGRIRRAAEEMKREGKGEPTAFEIETALSFLYFQEKGCDIVVLETGMGGALDATNVVRTCAAEVFTPISMDHMDFLGDTLEKIAEQKAGIIKPGTPVISATQEEEAARVLERVCGEKGCSLFWADKKEISQVIYGLEVQSFFYKDWGQAEIALAGSYQIENAALALETAEALNQAGFSISREQALLGLKKARWRGRFTLLHKNPWVLLDGAHNPGAAKELRRSLELYFQGKKLYYVFGIFRDKDYREVIRQTAPLASRIFTVETPGNPRALPAKELKKEVEKVNPRAQWEGDLKEAVKKALKLAGKEDAVIIFGSLSFLKEAEEAVKAFFQEEKS